MRLKIHHLIINPYTSSDLSRLIDFIFSPQQSDCRVLPPYYRSVDALAVRLYLDRRVRIPYKRLAKCIAHKDGWRRRTTLLDGSISDHL